MKALALFLVACGPVDAPILRGELAEVEQAIEDQAHARLFGADGLTVTLTTAPSLPSGFAGECAFGPGMDAIRVVETLGPGMLPVVLVHEIGHALGLEHAPRGVMQPRVPWMPLSAAAGSLVEECGRQGACRETLHVVVR